jgi:hypothetical protein
MKTKRGILGLILGLMVLPGPSARSAGVMGPPVAILEEGQWTVGVEYGYAETGLKAHGTRRSKPHDDDAMYHAEFLDVKGLKSRMVFGSLAYGIVDSWDVFVRLGTADGRGRTTVRTIPVGDGPERFRYDGGYGLACGLGTRATFCYWGPWQFGGTTQVTWLDPGKSRLSWSDPDAPGSTVSGRANADLWHVQTTLAATYQIDVFRFWAGPFVQFVRGNVDRRGATFTDGLRTGTFAYSGDIEETSQAGVHFGAIWQMSPRTNAWIEGQYTRDSWVFGFGAAIAPAQFFRDR